MDPRCLSHTERSVRRVAMLTVSAGVLLLCGCSLMPWRRGPVPMEILSAPIRQPVATVADSLPATPASPASARRRPKPPPRIEAGADTTAAGPSEAPMSPAPSGPALTIQLTEEERVRLIDETEKDTQVANASLQRLDRNNLTPGQIQAISDIEDLLKSVAKSRAEDDLQAAARLARKARLLAEDLPGR